MTFFILIPLGSILALIGEVLGPLFLVGAAILGIWLVGQFAISTGHPEVVWALLIGGPIVFGLARDRYRKQQMQGFLRLARAQLDLRQDIPASRRSGSWQNSLSASSISTTHCG